MNDECQRGTDDYRESDVDGDHVENPGEKGKSGRTGVQGVLERVVAQFEAIQTRACASFF
jgi:hypothetical protein